MKIHNPFEQLLRKPEISDEKEDDERDDENADDGADGGAGDGGGMQSGSVGGAEVAGRGSDGGFEVGRRIGGRLCSVRRHGPVFFLLVNLFWLLFFLDVFFFSPEYSRHAAP